MKMENSEAITILKSLANGVDPFTNKELPKESPYENIKTTRALFFAISELEKVGKSKKFLKKPGQNKAGTLWTTGEETLLIADFEAGVSVKEISLKMERSVLGIHSRLFKLGKVNEKYPIYTPTNK